MTNYTRQGDYYLPNIKLPEQKEVHIGVWGQRHADYLKTHHKVVYYNLLTSCRLQKYLSEVDTRAEELFNSIVKQLAEKEHLTENMKATIPIKWAQKMNNIRNRAAEVVYNEVIYCI